MKQKDSLIQIIIFVFTFIAISCSSFYVSFGETSTPVPTNTFIPTYKLTPTKSPLPSQVPSPTLDPQYAETLAIVQYLFDEGRIPNINGKYIELDDFNKTFAQIGYFQSYSTNIELESFVFIGHVI